MLRNGLKALGACFLVSAALGLRTPAGAQPPNPELTRILDLMEQRQKQAGIIRIKAEGTRFVPKGARSERFGPDYPPTPTSGDPKPPSDELTELRQDITFDYVGQRYRRLYSEKLGAKFDSWIGVYDGKKSYGSKADLPIEQLENFSPTNMSSTVGAGKANIFNSAWWPYLIAGGSVITNRRGPYYLSHFSLALDRDNLFLYGSESADGVPCAVLRTFPYGPKGQERFLEYAVGKTDGAVRRLADLYGQSQKDIEITINYRKINDRLAPTKWVNSWYMPNSQGKLFQRESMTVTVFEVDGNLSERFFLTPAPGAIVRERQYAHDLQVIREGDEKIKHYQVDESGRWIEGDLKGGQFHPNGQPWLWIAVGAGVALVVVFVLVRRKWYQNREVVSDS